MQVNVLTGVLTAMLAIGLSTAAAAQTSVADAARRGSSAEVRRLITQGADVNQPQGDGATALHWAVYRGDLALAAVLIGAGANVNAVTDIGVTPLWLASAEAEDAIVERLLRARANPNAALPSGETPLMNAARVGRLGAVKLLLAAGAAVNASERSRGQSALMWAASQGHATVVQALTAAGADVHSRSSTYSMLVNVRPQGFTNSGARAGLSVQEFDARRPASSNTGAARTPPRPRAAASGADDADSSGVVSVEYGGYTPLLFAARQGTIEAARALIAAGADVNDTAPDGTSALVVAAHSGHTAVAELLLEKGADANAAGAGYSALHIAILRKDVALVKALVARGADSRAPLMKGTPARRNATDLMLGGPLIGAQSFLLAARFGEPAIMRILVAAGADVTSVTPDGTTPIMAAMAGPWLGEGMAIPRGPVESERRALDAITAAVELGVDVNAVNGAGDTAVHIAVSRGFETVVRFLAGKGANLAATNKKGLTPLALALAQQRESTAALLRELSPNASTDRRQ